LDTFTDIKRRHRTNEFQTKILKNIADVGKCSKSSLTKLIHTDYPNIHDSVEILKEKKFLHIVDEKQNRGKKEIFYGLTAKGMLELVTLGIELEMFWKMLIQTYNRFPNTQLEITIDEMFSAYEKKELPISKDHRPVLWTNFLTQPPVIDQYYEKYFYILDALVHNVSLTVSQLNYRLGLKSVKESSALIKEMLDMMLIVYDNSNKLRLSHLGVLLLLNKLLKQQRANITLTNYSNQNFELFNKIVMDNRKLFPEIFLNWDKLIKIENEPDLIKSLIFFINETDPWDIDNFGEYKKVFDILKRMANAHHNYAQTIVSLCINTLKEKLVFPEDQVIIRKVYNWLKTNYPSKPPKIRSKVLPNLDIIRKCIEVVEEYSCFLPYTVSDPFLKEIGLTLEPNIKKNIIEPILRDIITFYFYAMFRYRFDNGDWRWGFITNENKKTLEIENRRKLYNDFLNQNERLRKSYNLWIEKIIHFEEGNLKEIEKIKIPEKTTD
jgi:hypothetical protein